MRRFRYFITVKSETTLLDGSFHGTWTTDRLSEAFNFMSDALKDGSVTSIRLERHEHVRHHQPQPPLIWTGTPPKQAKPSIPQ